jgi:hypothetical protein
MPNNTITQQLLLCIDNKRIELKHNIDGQYPHGVKIANADELVQERTELLRRDAGVAIPVPSMDANGLFIKEGSTSTRDFLKQQFEKIENTNSGRELLQTVLTAINGSGAYKKLDIVFQNCAPSSFRLVDNTPTVDLNLWANTVATQNADGEFEIFNRPLSKLMTSTQCYRFLR